MTPYNMETPNVWLTPKDVELIYGFSVSRQAALRSQGILPYHRFGRYIRYKRSSLDDFLDDHKVV